MGLKERLEMSNADGSTMLHIDREIHNLNVKLRDIHGQLTEERRGTEIRIEELLFINK